MRPRVAINGFGRIGRNVFRANLKKNAFDIVAINDLGDVNTMAHLLQYDSLYGPLNISITTKQGILNVNGQEIKMFSQRDPEQLPWLEEKIDIVLECTGFFTHRNDAVKHIQAGAKKVIVSAPGKEMDLTVVLGVNEDQYDNDDHHIISNASCTTNCLAPIAKILHENFKIKKGLMTTTHAYTNDQQILDLPHKDLRRARAAALSIIPTTTGAAEAVGLVLPELKGKLTGLAMRVPIPTVSIVDLVIETEKETSAQDVNQALKKASESTIKDYLAYTEKPLVSMDFKGDSHSAIVDALSTMVIGNNLIKVLAWYDNEWGYSNRVVDLVKYMGERM
ncbi:MAG: glyceraldehyde-3-phosphate dehydrogenase, glyceraldehyde 3-phosphate dehydrogenase [Candidatus Peregrinibacteria bacterium GW2011_GWE2_39_6]|nr:MAG: glyceraldehyde-3-phosphate dehydrogenase, glyceraldehyde 3-phosphate dehydrogenase [Candidatus Peregrinibacteria bacterium GW2011_GWF2_39_17]KKR24953.1 MAG: glyceraldehyde-3-phosphate dehydrogenase, glyceraldehyde 3-phosphate dehydrogenase [Candidatus Peregrinibacteria bacterium GW2011_GWE2_39_6]